MSPLGVVRDLCCQNYLAIRTTLTAGRNKWRSPLRKTRVTHRERAWNARRHEKEGEPSGRRGSGKSINSGPGEEGRCERSNGKMSR